MKKRPFNKIHFSSWIFLCVLLLSILLLSFISISKPSSTLHTRAAASSGQTISVSGTSVKAIQDAIESAKDGDTIVIPSGTYASTLPVVTDPDYKYQTCLIHTRKKSLTLRGSGNVVIDNQNGGLSDESQKTWSTGICVLGGSVTIDNIAVKQTLRPGMVVWNAQAIIKNFKTIDIDNAAIDVNNSKVIILNSVFWPGIGVGGAETQAIIENNTFFGGITFNLCKTSEPTVEFSNNVVVRGGISLSCPEQSQRKAKIKSKNNIVYHGSPKGDQSCVGPGNTEGETCGSNELCEGTTFVWPGFVGADENGTICAWGEGWMQGDINTKADSPATKTGAGISTGPCSNGTSTACDNYIKSKAFSGPTTPPIEPTEPPPSGTPVPTTAPTTTPSPTRTTSSSSSSLSSQVSSVPMQFPGLLTINNAGTDKLYIQGVFLKTNYDPINKFVEAKQTTPYLFKYECESVNEEINGGVLYINSKGETTHTKLHVFCNKTNLFDIQ